MGAGSLVSAWGATGGLAQQAQSAVAHMRRRLIFEQAGPGCFAQTSCLSGVGTRPEREEPSGGSHRELQAWG